MRKGRACCDWIKTPGSLADLTLDEVQVSEKTSLTYMHNGGKRLVRVLGIVL